MFRKNLSPGICRKKQKHRQTAHLLRLKRFSSHQRLLFQKIPGSAFHLLPAAAKGYNPRLASPSDIYLYQPDVGSIKLGRVVSYEREFDMAITVAQKALIMTDFQRAAGDSGSSEVQVALLTARIN